MSATIQWLIDQNTIGGITCIAGESGVNRTISGVNIMDNPDTVPWLKTDELILSTGYLFSSTDLYKTIITDLYERGCCGLGIKMYRYLNELPQEMVDQANALNFTILSIPFECTMEQIVNVVYRKLFEDETSESQRIASIYKSITEAALKKRRLVTILENISHAVKTPVFLTTPAFEIIEYYIPQDSSLSFPFPYSKDATTLFSNNDLIRLQEEYIKNPVPVRAHAVLSGGAAHNYLVFSIAYRKKLLGYLVCMEENHRFTAGDYGLISNIESLLSFSLMNSGLLSDEQRLSQDVFYSKLLSGSLQTESEIASLCQQNGFDHLSHRVCIAFQIEGFENLSIVRQRAMERKVWDIVSPLLSDTEGAGPISKTVYSGKFIIFLTVKSPFSTSEMVLRITKALKSIIKKLSQENIPALCSIGKCMEGALTVSHSYIQSLSALELGKKLHPERKIFSYYEDQIYHELSANFTHAHLTDFYNATIKPLDDYDIKNGSELAKTLYTFLCSNQNISHASKALYIHRNTMMYRMDQIHQLTGLDLKSLDGMFMANLGFYAKKLLSF